MTYTHTRIGFNRSKFIAAAQFCPKALHGLLSVLWNCFHQNVDVCMSSCGLLNMNKTGYVYYVGRSKPALHRRSQVTQPIGPLQTLEGCYSWVSACGCWQFVLFKRHALSCLKKQCRRLKSRTFWCVQYWQISIIKLRNQMENLLRVQLCSII